MIDEDVVRAEVLDGLTQVDETFVLDDLVCVFNKETRKLTVSFTATNESGNTIDFENVWE